MPEHTTIPKKVTRAQARLVSDRCADAYSADAYRSWCEVARTLLAAGLVVIPDECAG